MYSMYSKSYNVKLRSIFTTKRVFYSALIAGLISIVGCDNSSELQGLETPDLNYTVGDPLSIESDNLELTDQSKEFSQSSNSISLPISCRNNLILDAYNSQTSSVQVKGCGQVVAVLPDDLEGSRHQRMIVKLDDLNPSHTVLIAHNIDLAPKIDSLQEGDSILFYGEYEYNLKGGVVHWTHHDPAARHQHGWIEHEGKRYE